MLRLLLKTLGKEFYTQHAGLFLFGIYVLFGVVEPSQLISYQKSLLLAGISSPTGIALVISSWFIYCLKAYFFVKQRFSLSEYRFIKETGSQARNVQLKLWLKFYSVILLPILIYVVLLVWLGIQNQLYASVLCIALAFISFSLGLAWCSFHAITLGFLTQESRQIFNGIKIRRPFFSWPIFHLINEQPLMLIICKVLSLILFKGILWMFADVGTDIRVLLTALLASVLCHSVLMINLLNFEIESLQFVRSLPVKTTIRLRNWLLIFVIVLLPEWLFLTIASHYNLYFIVTGLLFAIASLVFFLTLLYMVKLTMRSYLKWLFCFFFVVIWGILGDYYILFSLVLITWSISFYFLKFRSIDLKNMR